MNAFSTCVYGLFKSNEKYSKPFTVILLYLVSDSASTSLSRVAVVPAANDATDSTASETKDSYGRMKCMLCRKAPPDGCIVHGRTGHQVCCLACAQKLKDDNKPCPVCRKKIGRVIKNFM